MAAAPYWPDADDAGQAVLQAALTVLGSVRVVRCDPSLPAPGVYGVPAQWPRVERLLTAAGFRPGDRTEVILLAEVCELDVPHGCPSDRTPRADRSVGINGTRLSTAHGFIEVEIIGAEGSRTPGLHGWADIGNLHVDPGHRRQGIGRRLIEHAARWLRLGHVDRLLHYVDADDAPGLAFASAVGFTELARTRRGWLRPQEPPGGSAQPT